MANQELDTAALLKVEIRPDELSTLLERLAATEAMYGEPASTIRDVAELTEASPNLIARLLADIRNDSELKELQRKVETHDGRIEAVERIVNQDEEPLFFERKTPLKKISASRSFVLIFAGILVGFFLVRFLLSFVLS